MLKKMPPLPSYEEYRKAFVKKGVVFPLKKTLSNKIGFLSQLPTVENKIGWPWKEEVNPLEYEEKINWPKISVISPSYNQGQYFEETIRSILLQNYPNLEYIIMDGGSNDNTISILEKYDPWIGYWESEKDRGQSHAINKGFSLASGEIFCWINSDDYFTKGTLKKVALTFLASKAQFIYGNCYNLKNGELESYKAPIVFDRYLCIPGLAQPSIFWDSKIHQAVWEELNCTLDFELWMRMAKGARKKYINNELSVARQHEESKTHTTDEKLKQRWLDDHHKQWSYHDAGAWDKLARESRYIRKLFSVAPFLKNLF